MFKINLTTTLVLFGMFFFFKNKTMPVDPTHGSAETIPMKHNAWDTLLKKYVDDDGQVDYEGFKKASSELDAYLHELAVNYPSKNWTKEDRLAYYINLYNAGTIKLITANYPVKSIKDIKRPWDQKWLRIGDKMYSLGDIEHEILRKMNEPRIHFAINCASFSCPKLINEAYKAEHVDQQLHIAAVNFINDPNRNIISTEKAQLSEIFKWFKKDFTENGSLTDFVNQYAKTTINRKTKTGYLDYDWSLNEAK
ncbi:DUF547 domain-containing protein [Arenibacter sp. GZD96]|uniref:DUF547 domain-containing protein n=1 Tax=Aurantibrevibacter litoralis TaxID=3106030 RepID=UPI002AFE32FD|nr:DUF547 domain-containing protein [Arenibacter sp. GZD-96]MEA1785584.1 DUF547 domain-containing protein [Arenibacter sp. GZD-96]